MKQIEREDKLLKQLMNKSSVEIPFSDFEDKMMDQIYREQENTKSVSKNIRIAWFFFFLGLFFGLLITNMTANLDSLIEGVPVKQIALFTQVGIAVLLLFQLDKLIDFRFKKKL